MFNSVTLSSQVGHPITQMTMRKGETLIFMLDLSFSTQGLHCLFFLHNQQSSLHLYSTKALLLKQCLSLFFHCSATLIQQCLFEYICNFNSLFILVIQLNILGSELCWSCKERGNEPSPIKICEHRFFGVAIIASADFQNPRVSPAHILMFNPLAWPSMRLDAPLVRVELLNQIQPQLFQM